MSWSPITYALLIVEAAAKDESQHGVRLEAGVMGALEYACAHDFMHAGLSLASYAAGAAVALVGRNEGGKTLSREAVTAIADRLALYFQADSQFMEA